MDRGTDELSRLEAQLAENLIRQDLSPIETARAYQRMMNDWDVTAKDLSSMISVSPSKISRTLRLLELDETKQEAVVSGEMSPSVAIDSEPRKRPRKQTAKKTRKPKAWTYKPSRGVCVTVTGSDDIESALRSALDSLRVDAQKAA